MRKMKKQKRPEIFEKSKFCKAVCGLTEDELHDRINKKYIDPITEAPGDMPELMVMSLLGGIVCS